MNSIASANLPAGSGPAPEFQTWLARLRAGAVVPPLVPRVPLWSCGTVIGSVEPGLPGRSGLDRLAFRGLALLRPGVGAEPGWYLEGETTAALALAADHLRGTGFAGAWRDEQLAVHGRDGRRAGTVERGVARVLGIATQAVHLVGMAPDGRIWVQQRAFDKPNDPGLWDTLMGGMVSAADTVDTALVRETWEEAGLHAAQLQDMRQGGRLETARPSTDGRMGYVHEYIDWFVCTVPQDMVPVNQDGEVERFGLMGAQEVIARMAGGDFTAEAALILADAMGLA